MIGTETAVSSIAAKVQTAVRTFAQGSSVCRCDTICRTNFAVILEISKFWPVDPSIA